MRKIKKANTLISGFTLLELMAVVTIIGVLASVAIPQFDRYIKKSKTTEAYTNIRKVFDGEVAYYQSEIVDALGNVLPKRFVETTVQPAWPPGVNKQTGNFSTGNWDLIKFSPDSPLQYAYFADAFPFADPYPFRPAEYDVTADPPSGIVVGMRVVVLGDLDGDGEFSFFERAYGVGADGTEEISAAVYALDPLE